MTPAAVTDDRRSLDLRRNVLPGECSECLPPPDDPLPAWRGLALQARLDCALAGVMGRLRVAPAGAGVRLFAIPPPETAFILARSMPGGRRLQRRGPLNLAAGFPGAMVQSHL